MTLYRELQEGLGVAWGAIRANKLRSMLTTLGIVIGIVTVTLMGTAIQGLQGAFIQSIAALGSDVLYVERFAWFGNEEWWKVRNRREITLAQAREVARQATLAAAVSAEAGTMRTVKYKNLSANNVYIVGNLAESGMVRGITLQAGRFLSAEEVAGGRPVCVLGADVAANFFPHESPLGRRVRIDNVTFEVVGVMDKIGQFLGVVNFDNQVTIPLTRFLSDLARWPDVKITVKVRAMHQLEDAAEELRGIMRKIRRLEPAAPDDFAINRQDVFIKTFNQIGGAIAGVGLFITGLSLFVGGIGIMNIMFVSVAERTHEIGLRKALGAKRRTILLQFLLEAAGICLLGGLIGLGLAFPLSLVLALYLPTRLSLSLVALSLGVALVTGVVSGFFPAWRAARMNPVEALRNE